MREIEPRSDWVLGLSLVEVVLLVVFAVMIIYVADNVEGGGQEPHQSVISQQPQEAEKHQGAGLQAKLDAETKKSQHLEKKLGDMTVLVDELKVMVGAKVTSREGFQEAVETLKRGYAICQKDNTLIEARIQNGEETLQVIGDIPSDLEVNLLKGDETSDLDQIVSFIRDVYQYEKDHKCRFGYRLHYATDNDYRKARESFEKYFFPEKMIKDG